MGGESIVWNEWLETWTAVENTAASEAFSADRETAFNSQKFIIRYRPNLDEKMMVEFDGKQMDITAIRELIDTPTKHYSIILATYRQQVETVLVNVAPTLIHQFSQKSENFSGKNYPITNGTLYDPVLIDTTNEDIDNFCHLYRSGVRQLYPFNFTIVSGEIVFKSKVRGETIFYQQFNK